MNPPPARRAWAFLGSLGGLLVATLICLGLWRFAFRVSEIGGVRPSYKVTDYDPYLSEQAKTARDLIQHIERYHVAQRAYPVDSAALLEFLAPGSGSNATPAPALMKGWLYRRNADGNGYVLSRLLGWDPMLRYEADGKDRHWVFDPCDGSPERPFLPRGCDQ